ncbi:MAG: hypothetical protein KBT69_02710, partial [Oceanihabitans sp.]|nr:hypothetical protein [Oceanihabitans sp.]
MKLLKITSFFLFLLFLNCEATSEKKSSTNLVNVSFSDAVNEENLDGRLLLIFADSNEKEPRFLVSEGLDAQPIFGKNVENLKPNEKVSFDHAVFGFPYESLSQLKEGEYYVQAVLHVYETFNLSTGHTVKLPMDKGEGQQWKTSPGNLYSTPVKVVVTENGIKDLDIVLDQVIPEIVVAADTEWIKHIKMKSDLLSEFWGRDMYVGAHVLLPKG